MLAPLAVRVVAGPPTQTRVEGLDTFKAGGMITEAVTGVNEELHKPSAYISTLLM